MSWHEQLEQSVTTLAELRALGFCLGNQRPAAFPMRLTPHLLGLMERGNPECPIARQFIPDDREYEVFPGELNDSVNEEPDRIGRVLVHAYDDRGLLLCNGECAAYCRFCFRKRLVGREIPASEEDWEEAFRYLETHPEIHDVILSGGDPLLLADERLDEILGRLRRIPSIGAIRIHTRVLTVLPQRITNELIELLQTHRVFYLNLHVNHPRELGEEARLGIERLRRGGLALGSQTVLLKGINDTVEILRDLFLTLYHLGVRPYSLFHCERVAGCAHFRPTLALGRELWQNLPGWISGMAVPRYVLDTPEGRKIPLAPETCRPLGPGSWRLRDYRGGEHRYDETKLFQDDNKG